MHKALTHRKARPICRDIQTFRDDKLFIIACDDTYAPKQYFDFFHFSRVQVHVIPTIDGTSAAEHVLKRLLEVDYLEGVDERWMILDTDHCLKPLHFKGFEKALSEARQKKINIALSKPCFEYWLLLHHCEPSDLTALATAKDVEDKLRKTLGEYNKTSLQSKHYPWDRVLLAIQRATQWDAQVKNKYSPEINTTQIYCLWNQILAARIADEKEDGL